LSVRAENITISIIDASNATVKFTQYYRSGTYSDHGPKVLKIRVENDIPLIVFEDLEESYPG